MGQPLIQRLIPQRDIDYLMVSHWHGDHIGDPSLGCWKNAKGEQICGISAVSVDFTCGGVGYNSKRTPQETRA